MPRYVLLGATGSTGMAVLECLLSEPLADVRLSLLVRSREKLMKLLPELESRTRIPVEIFQGNVTNMSVLQRCLNGADVIFNCVAENYSRPGLSLARDTSNAIIDCLRNQQLQNGEYRKPTVVQLRTASLNPELAAQVPRLVHATVCFCLCHIYADLIQACENYKRAVEETPDLLDYIWVDPPTIHKDPRRTGYQLISSKQKQAVALSYADLGTAMCEIATRRGEFSRNAVGVSATGQVRTTWLTLLTYLLIGLWNRV